VPYLEFQNDHRHLGPGVLTIGSGREAVWRIPNHDLAPVHAIVTLERDGRARIAPRSSQTPLFVNGGELAWGSTCLAFGDSVRMGSATLQYRQFTGEYRATEAYLRDSRRGRLFRLTDEADIGRDPHCAVLVQELEVSRTHAHISRRGDEFVVQPGTAMTLLNGARLSQPVPLKEGDELVVGHTTLRFSREVPPANIAAASGSPAARGSGGAGGGGLHSAYLPTTFIGLVETQNRIRRHTRRRIMLSALVAGGVLVLAGALLGRRAVRATRQAPPAPASSVSAAAAPLSR
jgi:predicted component of type VI protein secretion system